ncbi:MAG: hypothetical protein HPY52_15020 [Firmicutes bacterium]|nr:hypothetical protein [Bacillota bacterium]
MSSGVPNLSKFTKPTFTKEQIIGSSEVQRKWRSQVESKLRHQPYLVMFSGSKPKATIMDYEKFEALWQKAQESSELLLELESLRRVMSAADPTNAKLLSLKEVMAKANITEADLEESPDVELESE